MAAETSEVLDFLLNCEVCFEPFDEKDRIPRILPCNHTFCSPCIAKLDKGGNLSCPNDRGEIRVSGLFPVDITRAAVVEHKHLLLSKGEPSPPLEEACQKHQDEKLKFFCTTCKSALCSECAVIEHGNKTGHKIVKLADVLEQVKRELEANCKELQHIRESSLLSRAKVAATSLQETEASFEAAEQKIEDVFSKAVNILLDRKAQAMEELRGKWKNDREWLENQALAAQCLESSALTKAALGRSVSSVGLPSHIVTQQQEVEGVVKEARAAREKPLPTSLSYEVMADLKNLMKFLPVLGSVVPVASQSSTVPTTPRMTPSTIRTPQFQLERGRCKFGCTLERNGRTLTNEHSDRRSFTFLGTCGSVDLAKPGLYYWTVNCSAAHPGSGDRCEIGLASLKTLETCGKKQRISDHDVNSATLVLVRYGRTARLVGGNWTKDMDTPPPPQDRDVIYTLQWENGQGYTATVGFLYDNRQPDTPRVLAVEVKSCRLLGVRRLSPSPPLRPVFRLWPTLYDGEYADTFLEVKTGPGILNDFRARQLQSLLEKIDR